jgi:hypothetical protein
MHPPNILADWKNDQEAHAMKTIPTRIMMLALGIALAIAGTTSTLGQNANSGEIKGTVTDNSNAVIPDVTVTILNIGTGVSTTTTTNGQGIYDVPSIPTGDYTITFSKTGFRDDVRKGVPAYCNHCHRCSLASWFSLAGNRRYRGCSTLADRGFGPAHGLR